MADSTVNEPVNTENEWAIHKGQNLPNSTWAMNGRAKYVMVGTIAVPLFRTRQQAYRFAAWLVTMAEVLPDEEQPDDWETVLEAVQRL